MVELLAHHADAHHGELSWPDAVALLGLLVFAGFALWLFLRD